MPSLGKEKRPMGRRFGVPARIKANKSTSRGGMSQGQPAQAGSFDESDRVKVPGSWMATCISFVEDRGSQTWRVRHRPPGQGAVSRNSGGPANAAWQVSRTSPHRWVPESR